MLNPPTLIGTLWSCQSHLKILANVQRPSCCHASRTLAVVLQWLSRRLRCTCLSSSAPWQWSSHFRKNTSELPGRAFQYQESWCSCDHGVQDRILGFILICSCLQSGKAESWLLLLSLKHSSSPFGAVLFSLLWEVWVLDILWAKPWEGGLCLLFWTLLFLEVTFGLGCFLNPRFTWFTKIYKAQRSGFIHVG